MALMVVVCKRTRTSSSRLLVPVGDPRALDGLAPNPDTLVALGRELGAEGFFVFSLSRGAGGLSTESRMFCPSLGIPEDPVSGNAHGMLGAYLARHGLLGPLAARMAFAGAQGHHVNRPGRVEIELEVDSSAVTGVWIIGQATAIFETQISL